MAEAALIRSKREVEEVELELLLSGVADHWGYDLRNYSRASLRRRVREAMRKEGVGTISALQERVLHDPIALGRFVASVSVHATSMFRDPEFYLALKAQVFPLLRTYPFLRIWHAGCASGEEVYSLAILLEEEGLYDRCRIYGTDISMVLLERAARGIVPLSQMKEYTRNYLLAGGKRDFSEYYAADDKNAILRDRLRQNMVFSQHNLVSDRAFNEFQLVLCRNVMIYFDEKLRERVIGLLHTSLVRFGVLGLGRKETLRYTAFGDRFEELPGNLRIYRRVR
jgi:chemotaxis protein methyltransferase CheR